MIEFSLRINLGAKESVGPGDDRMPVDREFIAQALAKVATSLIEGRGKGIFSGVIRHGKQEVGEWRLGLIPSERRWKAG